MNFSVSSSRVVCQNSMVRDYFASTYSQWVEIFFEGEFLYFSNWIFLRYLSNIYFLILKFKYSEKVTQVWKKSHNFFEYTK